MARPLTHLHIETGPSGWLKAEWRRQDEPENVVFVKMEPPKKKNQLWGPVGIRASRQTKPPWLSSELVRDIPFHRISLAVNASEVWKRGLLDLVDAEEPRDLDKAFKSVYKDAPRMVLERRPRNQLDDAFFRNIALAYRQAVAAGLPPLKTLATDSGIPQGTIARWVAETRERKFLPPAQKGKVTT